MRSKLAFAIPLDAAESEATCVASQPAEPLAAPPLCSWTRARDQWLASRGAAGPASFINQISELRRQWGIPAAATRNEADRKLAAFAAELCVSLLTKPDPPAA
jgi:hypothetical protein